MPRENYLQVNKGILWVSISLCSLWCPVSYHIFSELSDAMVLILTYLLNYDYINVP